MNKLKNISMLSFCMVMLSLFGEANVTYDSGMSVEMKIFYDTLLLKNAEPKLLHNKWGQKQPIPANNGTSIEFRRPNVLPKITTPIVEDILPQGQKMGFTNITATVGLYGAFIRWSTFLKLTAVDKMLVIGSKSLGSQSGRSLDTLTREVLNAGTTVQYANGKLARYLLVGGDATPANNDYITPDGLSVCALTLDNNLADGVSSAGGRYVAIAHPDSIYQLMKDEDWRDIIKSQNAQKLFDNEVGEYANIRVFKSTEAKIFHAANLAGTVRNLTSAGAPTVKTFTVVEALSAGEASALVGRKVLIKGVQYTVASAAAGSAGAATFTVSETVTGSPTTDIVYPGEAGAKGRDVYSMLVIGSEDAYGVTEITGGGLEMIVKPPQDELNLTSTQAWKATHTAVILCQLYLVRYEHCTEFQRGAN